MYEQALSCIQSNSLAGVIILDLICSCQNIYMSLTTPVTALGLWGG